jgi:threonine dehydratase
MTDLIDVKLIETAQKTLSKHIPKTPVTNSYFLSNKYGLNVQLKMENLNLSGSFKIRGATNALLNADQKLIKSKGVVAVSAGNHAQGVARTANLLGIKATIFMPKQAPLVKIEKTRNLGAEVFLHGNTFDEAEIAAKTWNKEHGAFTIHPFSDPNVIAGQGTVGLEILEDFPNAGAVLIPVGGGGLISGIACAIKEKSPETLVIGVQSELYSFLSKQFNKEKTNHKRYPGQSIADGIAVKNVCEYTFAHIEKYVDAIVSVDEDQIAAAIMELMERDHVLAEGAGAAGVAALELLSPEIKAKVGDKPIICLITGGNIDVSLLNRITKKGLLYSGRLMRLSITMDDKPGELANILTIIGESEANLYNIEHNRVFSSYGVKEVDVVIDLETINKEHQEKIIATLTESGYHVKN